MPFHLSAQAKLLRLRPQPLRSWLMGRCPLDLLRTGALAALRDVPDMLSGKAPSAGALDAHYAAVLRSGWEAEDLAVAVSCSNSPMGHVQGDSGTLVIGTRGNWLVADPGHRKTFGRLDFRLPERSSIASFLATEPRVLYAGGQCWHKM